MTVHNIEYESPLVKAVFLSDTEKIKRILEDDDFYEEDSNVSALHVAAFLGSIEISKLLLSKLSVNGKDERWLTPLHRACRSGSHELVDIFLKHGADARARDKNWQTCAHIASANNSLLCMKTLLSVTQVDVADRAGRTELHYAVYGGYEEMTALLLEHGASPTHQDKRNRQPLHWAAFRGHETITELLLSHLSDVSFSDKDGFTPLHVASASGQLSIVQKILESELNDPEELLHLTNDKGETPFLSSIINGHSHVLSYFLSRSLLYSLEVDTLTNQRESALHLASSFSYDIKVLQILLESGIFEDYIHTRDNRGRTPLHCTALRGSTESALMLLNYGAIVQKDSSDNLGRSLLHTASKYGHASYVKTLLQLGADVSSCDSKGRTPLHESVSTSLDVSKLLIEGGADVNASDCQGMTPLHVSALAGNAVCLEYLISQGVNVNQPDDYNRIPLHYASIRSASTVSLLLPLSDVDHQDINGMTALHVATSSTKDSTSKTPCVILLLILKANGNPHLKDAKHYLPLHYAAISGNPFSFSLLLQYMNLEDIKGSCEPSPLELAANYGHFRILDILLQRWNGISRLSSSSFSSLSSSSSHPILSCRAIVNDSNSFGETALMISSFSGHVECVKRLLQEGANVNQVDTQGRTALFRAAHRSHEEICCLLLFHGADSFHKDTQGLTPLHIASASGHLTLLLKIYSQKYSDLPLDKNGYHPLHWAILYEHSSIVSFFLETSRNPLKLILKSYSHKCMNLLHFAAFHNAPKSLESILGFLEDKVEVMESRDEKGRTPLLIASLKGHSTILSLLLQELESERALENMVDKKGNNALHVSIMNHHEKIALLLLEKNSEKDFICKQNNEGKTPLHLAASLGLIDTCELLLTYGASVTLRDNQGYNPALCCASSSDVATCLALILSVSYSSVLNSSLYEETRLSLRESISSLRALSSNSLTP